MSTDFEDVLARILLDFMRPSLAAVARDRITAALTKAGLIGGESETEYGVRWPIASDPSGFNYKVRHDLDEARTSVRIHPVWHGVVVSRTVTRSPWVPVEEVAGDE